MAKPDSAWGRVAFISLRYYAVASRAKTSRSAASPTSLPLRSPASVSLARQRANTSAPPAVASYRRTHWRLPRRKVAVRAPWHRLLERFSHRSQAWRGHSLLPHGLGDEEVPSLSQLSQGRGVAVIRFRIDQERHPSGSPFQYSCSPKPSSSNAATSWRGRGPGRMPDLPCVLSRSGNSHERTRRCGCFPVSMCFVSKRRYGT